jgi:hypothetical protein
VTQNITVTKVMQVEGNRVVRAEGSDNTLKSGYLPGKAVIHAVF